MQSQRLRPLLLLVMPLLPPVTTAAGRADIQAGQQVLQGKLDLLLQRQQAAIDAMNAANSQLAALQVRLEWQMPISTADYTPGCLSCHHCATTCLLGTAMEPAASVPSVAPNKYWPLKHGSA